MTEYRSDLVDLLEGVGFYIFVIVGVFRCLKHVRGFVSDIKVYCECGYHDCDDGTDERADGENEFIKRLAYPYLLKVICYELEFLCKKFNNGLSCCW